MQGAKANILPEMGSGPQPKATNKLPVSQASNGFLDESRFSTQSGLTHDHVSRGHSLHTRHHKTYETRSDSWDWWHRTVPWSRSEQDTTWTHIHTQTGLDNETDSQSPNRWLHVTNTTFPLSALEHKPKYAYRDHSITATGGPYAVEQWTKDSISGKYPSHIPSMSEYASQNIPSQSGFVSHLTGGEYTQHIPTVGLYGVLELSNSSNASYIYNISHEMLGNNSEDLYARDPPEIVVTTLEIVIAIVLAGFIIAIIIGNLFVILSVALFRDMRTLTNGLIVSLASADLLVAIIVLPISLYHEIIGSWTLGPYVCDFWITSDVFCCTASILNIVVIAADRYWLITKNVRYTHNTTFPRQRVVMVLCFCAWLVSAIISSSPLLGWRTGTEKMDPYQCLISQDIGYTVFSTFGAFWFPLGVILIVYMKIFKIARKRARTRAKAQAIHPSINSTALSEANGKPVRYSRPSRSDSNSPENTPKMIPRRRVSTSHSRRRSHRGRIRSSARTLGLIIGGFVFCWLPFFILATILPFCAACQIPPYLMSVVLWLGYSNSLLNPAIYAIWDKNFRRSFKRLATCSVRWSHVL